MRARCGGNGSKTETTCSAIYTENFLGCFGVFGGFGLGFGGLGEVTPGNGRSQDARKGFCPNCVGSSRPLRVLYPGRGTAGFFGGGTVEGGGFTAGFFARIGMKEKLTRCE